MSLIMKNGEAYGKGGGGDVSGRAMSTAIAPEFDPSESYVVGDKVMHEDEYYVFTADHTGAWDDADVDPTDVDSEIPKAMSEDDLDDIKDAFVPNTGAPLRMMNYSTDEQVVGTWIDGKTLYQKTVEVNLPAMSAKSGNDITVINATDAANMELINAFGRLVRSDGYIMPFPFTVLTYQDGTTSCNVRVQQLPDKSIKVQYRAYTVQDKPFTAYVTLQYTKTTD